ncbi:hypothetical protein AtEden1_Chr1g0042941 [Arabidopsis thaliana]
MDLFGKSLLVDKSVFVARSAFVIGITLAAKATEQWLKRGG